MSTIEFKCSRCSKKVSAPEKAGGRMGNCPYCQQRCYVPLPPGSVEEFDVQQLSPEEELREQQLKMEAMAVNGALLEDQPTAESPDRDKKPELKISTVPSGTEPVEKTIVKYLLAVGKGDLQQGEVLAKQIAQHGKKALKVIDELAIAGVHDPALQDIPDTVIAGLFRQLRKELAD